MGKDDVEVDTLCGEYVSGKESHRYVSAHNHVFVWIDNGQVGTYVIASSNLSIE